MPTGLPGDDSNPSLCAEGAGHAEMLPEARSVRDFPGSWFKNKRKGRPDLQSHRVGDMPSRVTGHRRERMLKGPCALLWILKEGDVCRAAPF